MLMWVFWQLAPGAAKESSGAGLPAAGTLCAGQGARAWACGASPCGRGAPGSAVLPDALHHHRAWRLPFVRALHSLLGNLPSHNASPALALGERSSSAGERPPCPLTPPVRWGWLRVLRQHVTSSLTCCHCCHEPCSSPSASKVGLLCSLGHVPSSSSRAEWRRDNTQICIYIL